jgi:hypothetical protein
MTPPENYQIGITPLARETPAVLIKAVTDSTLQGDPGDWGDINRVMETVSACMYDLPATHVFKRGCMKHLLVVFHVPRSATMMVVDTRDFANPQICDAVTNFGFNPATLQPIKQGI